MKVTIDENISAATYYDKDYNVHASNNELIHFNLNDCKNNDKLNSAIKVITDINNFNYNEVIVYQYIIKSSLYKFNMGTPTNTINLSTNIIEHLATVNTISKSSITRGIVDLTRRGVINYLIEDNKIIPATYTLNSEYNILKYFTKDGQPHAIVIPL